MKNIFKTYLKTKINTILPDLLAFEIIIHQLTTNLQHDCMVLITKFLGLLK